MATISIEFLGAINVSLQVGDTAYFCDPSGVGGFQVGSGLTEIGNVESITVSATTTTIVCDIDANATPPSITSFVLFSKNNLLEMSSIKGYYGEVTYKNNTPTKAEMYATACEIAESSK